MPTPEQTKRVVTGTDMRLARNANLSGAQMPPDIPVLPSLPMGREALEALGKLIGVAGDIPGRQSPQDAAGIRRALPPSRNAVTATPTPAAPVIDLEPSSQRLPMIPLKGQQRLDLHSVATPTAPSPLGGRAAQLGGLRQPSGVFAPAPFDATPIPQGTSPAQSSVFAPMAPDAAPVIQTPQPRVAMAPSPTQQNIQNDQQQLEKVRWNQANPWGTANNHPGTAGKIAHVLSVAGNIAGGIFAPATMALVPGTQMNMMMKEGGLAHRLNEETAQETENEARQAQTTHENASTEALQNPRDKFTTLSTDQGEMRFDPATGDVQPLQVGGNTLQAPDKKVSPVLHETDQGLMLVNPDTKEVTPLTLNGKPLMPKNTTNPKEQVQRSLLDAEQKGDKAAVAKYQQQLKDMDPLGQQRLQVTIQGQNAANNRAEDTVSRQDVRAHDKAYVQPAEMVEKSYQMMDHAYQEYQNARKQGKELPTGAQSMLALSTHLSTTFGNVKGARVTKDMIEHHLGARSISDSALVAFQKLTNGDTLSPGQWDAFHELIKQSRNLSWSGAVKEAARKHIPIDFLPPELQTLKRPDGTYTMGQDGQYHLQKGEQ